MLNIALGLLGVMAANVLLGASLAKLQQEFSWEKMLSGGFKVICILGAAALMYGCSFLNPDIIVVSINNANVNLIEAMRYVGVVGITFYGAQDIKKLIDILKVNVEVSNPVDEPTIEVKQENYLDRGDE